MSKEKLLIKEKLINYSKRYYAKVVANNNDDLLCFDLQGAKMPKDTFKTEVRSFMKDMRSFVEAQLKFNERVMERLDSLETWKESMDAWKDSIDTWKKNIDKNKG